mmetsp:Transcript_6246/g.9890  ORF Transcript_6246/g.9890 Transcript_6246/m.9890 type:complete len:219 (-) Transcript_6246:2113-2769(-)
MDAAVAWGEDPLFWSCIPLSVAQIHGLAQDVRTNCQHSLYGLHPVSKAQVLGVIVCLKETDEWAMFSIDDGTGVIKCTEWKQADRINSFSSLKYRVRKQNNCVLALGGLVRVDGRLKMKWRRDDAEDLSDDGSTRELIVFDVTYVNDPNAEILHWLQIKKNTTNFYRKPRRKAQQVRRKHTARSLEELSAHVLNSIILFDPYHLERPPGDSLFSLKDI